MAKKYKILCILLVTTVVFAAGLYIYLLPWGFAREVAPLERAQRLELIAAAEKHLGANEADESHRPIIDLYNAHQPLAQDYVVQYSDSWCATFVSAMAIEENLTDRIPTECSCQRQISLLQDLGRWQEQDTYVPLPGDLIYYDWDEWGLGDSQGWADHVGIVVGTKGPFIKSIEGNWKDSVTYHYTFVGFPQIRGYGLPFDAKN